MCAEHFDNEAFVSALPRRQIFYLLHHWRKEHQHHGSSNGGGESLDDGSHSHVNGQKHAGEAMEVDGATLPDQRNSKRLKRGVLLPEPPALSAEYDFVSDVLDKCRSPEERRFAQAYRKWIDAVIDQQP